MILVQIHTVYQKYVKNHQCCPEYVEMNRECYDKLKKVLNRNRVDRLFLKKGGLPVVVDDSLDRKFRLVPEKVE